MDMSDNDNTMQEHVDLVDISCGFHEAGVTQT